MRNLCTTTAIMVSRHAAAAAMDGFVPRCIPAIEHAERLGPADCQAVDAYRQTGRPHLEHDVGGPPGEPGSMSSTLCWVEADARLMMPTRVPPTNTGLPARRTRG
jgi:hypothetical protein